MAGQGPSRPDWFEFALLKLSVLGMIHSSHLHFILKHLVNMFIPLSIRWKLIWNPLLSHFTFLLAFESYLFPVCFTRHFHSFVYKTPDIVLSVEYEYKILAIICMTSLCNETARPSKTHQNIFCLFLCVFTLSTVGSLTEARWNLAAKASSRSEGRRGAVAGEFQGLLKVAKNTLNK